MLDTPTDPASLVAYQDGSIVSRTILKDKAGTITLFAFATGEALSEHETPYEAYIQVLDGQATITIDGAEHLVDAGQMIHLPANVPHAVRADQSFKMMLTMIRS